MSEDLATSEPSPQPRGIPKWAVFLVLSVGMLGAAVYVGRTSSKPEAPKPGTPAGEKTETPLAKPGSDSFEGKPLTEWVAALKDKDAVVRRETAAALTQINANSRPALTALLLETLKDDDADVRQLSAYVLGNVHPAPETVMPGLGAALRDKEKVVRRSVAVALVQIGRTKPEALNPILEAASKDEDADVRRLVDYIKENVKSSKTAPPRTTAPGSFGISDPLVGKPAPKIEAEDLNGVRFKLSDYQGKVVVLSFWADWCPPCRGLYPHERSMVDRFKNRPFVLVGVNLDPDKVKLKKRMVQERIIWRSFWDGTEGAISGAWNVKSIPTIFILDPKGVVWCRMQDAEMLDAAVETLLSDLERQRAGKK